MNKTAYLFIGIAGLILILLFLLVRPADSPPATAQPDAAPQSAASDPVPRFVIQQQRRVRGPATVQARQGQTITFLVTSDRDDELHVHGYDRHLPIHAGGPQRIEFSAEHAGRFEVELHAVDLLLTTLEIQPR